MKYMRVYASVNLDAIKSNLEQMKSNIKKDTMITAVIKTDGYGHGAVPIAHEIEECPYLYGFAVATIEEAVILRKSGIKKPIIILGFTFPDAYKDIVTYDIRPAVFKEDMARELSMEAAKQHKTVHFHLKVDTGMSRIGMMPEESSIPLVQIMKNLPGVEIEGIFTHFAKADMMDKGPTDIQIQKFTSFIQKLENAGIRIPIHHCSNSAGIVEIPDANMDMVRAGITLYGLWPSDEVKQDIISLTPVLELKSHIVYIKEIEPGTQVSYGGTYQATNKRRIATIPVGYGDGYPRSLSGKGYVLIKGKKAPILGRVCMDQFMVDVTDIQEAEEFMEVTLIGKDENEILSMEEIGIISGRFNYELACDLGKRIPRVYLKNGKEVKTKDYFDDYR
ncbi:MAG: alanine racemase [Lachnospiraceae bacterium]|nr:alanine racemase [Lachnospiraceae bacterium]